MHLFFLKATLYKSDADNPQVQGIKVAPLNVEVIDIQPHE
jgi:hypothetical protein